jgi:hypothetical protein
MTALIAFCGLDCAHCGAYRATQADDDALRAATAREWSERYGVDIAPEQIVCDGCRGDGRKFGYCEHVCELRKCGLQKGVETCAACAEYPCATLAAFLDAAPEAREALDALRKQGPPPA